MRFDGTKAYVATDDLKVAVNAAITLERPLLVKGEPGTGKTVLAIEIAKALGAPLPDRGHHVEQREGIARRIFAPLFLPLHPLPRSGHDDGDHRGAFPWHQAATGERSAKTVLRNPRCAGHEEEAVDVRAARLAQAADGRGHRPGNVARA